MAEQIIHAARPGPPITCGCGTCQRCRERVRQRELRRGVERHRTCAADGCSESFYAYRADKIYCSKRCCVAEAMRRYRRTEESKAYQREWREANPEKQHEYQQRWYQNGGQEKRAASKRENREKVRAHSAVLKAIEKGQLVREPCEVCGATKVDGHHKDYSKPLEVRWLCRKHHIGVHSGEVVLSQSA